MIFPFLLLLCFTLAEISLDDAVLDREAAVPPPRKVARLSSPVDRRQTRSLLPGLDLTKCLFCQAEKKQRKDRRLVEKLVRCTSFGTPETLLNAAFARQDDGVLLEIMDADVHAKGIMYHTSCYKIYTCPRQLALLSNSENKVELEMEDTQQQRAFFKLAEIVEKKFRDDINTVMSFANLTNVFKNLLEKEGVDTETFKAHHLKVKLMQHFGDRISFHRPHKRNEAQYVFSRLIDPGPLIERCLQLAAKQEEEASDGLDCGMEVDVTDLSEEVTPKDDALHIYHSAKILRKAILSMEHLVSSPPRPEELVADNIKLPACLYNFLCWLVHGESPTLEGIDVNEPVQQPPTSTHRRVLSIGQDMIFCASKGKMKTPKHVALPIALKHLTGSSQAVTILNRFGHVMSESQLEEVETAFAEKHLSQSGQGEVIPANIVPSSYITLCWDNNDIAEETSSGQGTTHCTNGIIVEAHARSFLTPWMKVCHG